MFIIVYCTYYHLYFYIYYCNTRSLTKMGVSAVKRTTSEVRLDEKVLHCCWHPVNSTVAVAGHAGLCLYNV